LRSFTARGDFPKEHQDGNGSRMYYSAEARRSGELQIHPTNKDTGSDFS